MNLERSQRKNEEDDAYLSRLILLRYNFDERILFCVRRRRQNETSGCVARNVFFRIGYLKMC